MVIKDRTMQQDPSIPTDAELVAEFHRDLTQLNIFEDLISRYEQKLLRYAMSLGLDYSSSQDVVQETFIKSYQNIQAFNVKKGTFSSWIYRIAHNCSIDFFRRNKNYAYPEDETWWDSVIDQDSPNLARELDTALSLRKLMASAQTLPLKYKEPLLLFYLQNKSYKQISEILRMPVATVSTRVRRAKMLLQKEILKEELLQKNPNFNKN